MKTGVLLFAFNNDQINYLKLAEWSAKNIQRHLECPVSLVTDVAYNSTHFESIIRVDRPKSDTQRYFSDINAKVSWFNGNRSDAYTLSPYDHTIVLDVDYVVASNQLTLLKHLSHNFLCHRHAYDVTALNDFESLNKFGICNMPTAWATVMSFKKSKEAELIFSAMQMIKQNYSHYKNLYQIDSPKFRNDYALSVALNIVNGHVLTNIKYLPWKLATVTPEHTVSAIDQDHYTVYFKNQNKDRRIEIKNMD